MAEFVTVAKDIEIPEGTSKAFTIGQKTIAVFHQPGGVWQAIDDYCPHMGASLSAGYLDGVEVICPWHNSSFSLETGAHRNPPAKTGVKAYRTQIEGNDVQVEV